MKILDGGHISELEKYLKPSSKKSEIGRKETPYVKGTENVEDASRGSDSVSLSERAKGISEAGRVMKNSPDIREDKVAEIKNRIDSGNYDVSGEEIAAKILKASIMDKII